MHVPVVLPTVSTSGLHHVIAFLYSGMLVLTRDVIEDVLAAAHLFQITDMLDFCSDFLREEMSKQTCLKALQLADKYALQDLQSCAMSFILENFVSLSETEDFKDLSLETLCWCLKEDKLRGSEVDIFR